MSGHKAPTINVDAARKLYCVVNAQLRQYAPDLDALHRLVVERSGSATMRVSADDSEELARRALVGEEFALQCVRNRILVAAHRGQPLPMALVPVLERVWAVGAGKLAARRRQRPPEALRKACAAMLLRYFLHRGDEPALAMRRVDEIVSHSSRAARAALHQAASADGLLVLFGARQACQWLLLKARPDEKIPPF